MGDDYDQYFTGMSTLGGNVKASSLYGNQQFKDIFFHFGCLGEALTLSVTQPYLVPALQRVMPHDMLVLGFEMAKQFTIQFAIIGAGAAIGATIGGLAGTVTIPVVGTIAGVGSGAALGASVASWLLLGVGLAELAGQGPYIFAAGKDEMDRGMAWAMRGETQKAATEFAECFAQMLAVVIPLLLVAIIAKGCKGIGGFLVRNPAMVQYLEKSLFTPAMYSRASSILGFTEEEIKAYVSMSRGKILVARGCNPKRLEYIKANYHAKPVAVHAPWNTAKGGPYVGQVVCDVSKAGEALAEYDLKAVAGFPGKFQLVPKKNYNALLEGHYVEKFIDDDGTIRYRLLHRDGKPFTGDIDRVLYAEFTRNGDLKVGSKWANDDPREVAWMNAEMRSRMTNPVSYNVFQHGHAWQNLVVDQETGKMIPGWPSRIPGKGWDFSNEPLMVAVNGHLYILDWPQFAAFCKAFEQVGLLFPWT